MKHLVTTMRGIALRHKEVRAWGDILVIDSLAEEKNGDLLGMVCSILDSECEGGVSECTKEWPNGSGPIITIGVRNIAATQRIEEE